MTLRRVCWHGGPGVGKSTTAAHTFAELKRQGHETELIPEYVKSWAHQGRKPTSYDQLYIFAKQLKAEDHALRSVKSVVTDSPLLLNAAYSEFHKVKPVRHILELAKDFEKDYPSINFYINRTVPYVGNGRYQDHGEAVAFDSFLKDFLIAHLEGPLITLSVSDLPWAMEEIQKGLSGGGKTA